MRLALLAPLAFALSLFACGGSTADVSAVDASTADAARDDAEGTPDAPLDGATSDAGCPLGPVHCHQGTCIDDPPAVCANGQWVCPKGPPSCYADAGLDGGAPGSFACGPTLVCDGATQYCYEASGGPPPPPDSGIPGASYQCKPLPASCGAAPSCACLAVGGGCWCTADPHGALTESCAFP